MQLVCLSPVGDLELWILQESYNEIGSPDPTWRLWLYHDDYVCTFNATFPVSPQFWGREVLSDL